MQVTGTGHHFWAGRNATDGRAARQLRLAPSPLVRRDVAQEEPFASLTAATAHSREQAQLRGLSDLPQDFRASTSLNDERQ